MFDISCRNERNLTREGREAWFRSSRVFFLFLNGANTPLGNTQIAVVGPAFCVCNFYSVI